MIVEEVVLDTPHEVETQSLSQHHVLERLAEHRVFGALLPRSRQLNLVEEPEFHSR
jgi:hypothetical protein